MAHPSSHAALLARASLAVPRCTGRWNGVPSRGVTVAFSMSDTADGRSYILELRGELDIATVTELRQYVDEVAAHESLRLVIDLRELTFIDSTGIGLLVSANRALRGRLSVVGVQPPVQHVFDLSGLAGHWRGDASPSGV